MFALITSPPIREGESILLIGTICANAILAVGAEHYVAPRIQREPRIKLHGLQLRPILRQILSDSYSIFNIVSKSFGKVSV